MEEERKAAINDKYVTLLFITKNDLASKVCEIKKQTIHRETKELCCLDKINIKIMKKLIKL